MSENMLGLRQASEMKKCGRCCKSLNVDCFATNPKTNELYSKCEGCRPKHNASGHAKRDADLKKQNATLEAGETPETLICYDCGPQPIAAFGTNADTKKPLSRCKPCHVKMLAASAVCKATEEGKEANKRYKKSEKGKATNKRYDQSEKGRAADKRYNKSEKGQETAKRYREGDAGQETAKRRLDRFRASTAMQMDNNIISASNCLISGRYQTSPTFIARTGFASEAAFLSAVEATFEPGMTFSNHGTVWQLDHKIPRDAYNFDKPEDVKRCWSAKNVHALACLANKEKSWKLIDQYVAEAGVETFPVAWNGKFPTAEFKIEHAAKMMAQKMIEEEAAAAAEQPSGSNDFGPIEAPDSE
jgi:hypothetical protein